MSHPQKRPPAIGLLILAALAEHHPEPRTRLEIAEHAGRAWNKINRAVSAAQSGGLIEHVGDGRYRLTAAGLELVEAMADIINKIGSDAA